MASASEHSDVVSPKTARYESATADIVAGEKSIKREVRPARRAIKFPRKRFPGTGRLLPLRQILHRLQVEAIEELRIDFANARYHFTDDLARFGGRVARGLHAPQSMENDAGNRMHHCGEGRNGQHVTSYFNGALFGLAFDFLNSLRVGHGANVPDVRQNLAGSRLEQPSEIAIMIPGASNGLFINRALRRSKARSLRRRHIGLSAVEANVALALLLGVIERMRMQKGPDKLPADVLEPKFKVGVLVDGVVAAEERSRADVYALLLGDFVGLDQPSRVASARCGNRGIERMRERVAKSDSRSGGFNQRPGGVRQGRELRGHLRRLYTARAAITRAVRQILGSREHTPSEMNR